MRRSLAPSQVKQRLSVGGTDDPRKRSEEQADEGQVIERVPLFSFLSIPDSLKSQFRIPKGCVITQQSIALRKVKTLGFRKSLKILRPGDYLPPLPQVNTAPGLFATEDEEEVQESPPELPPFEPLVLWVDADDLSRKVEVIPQLACRLRPHQREGVQFLFECTMGLRGFEGEGCILADDMGLGKTLMSITLIWTLLNQGLEGPSGPSAVRKVIVVCPTSLVGNWENELKKWVGDHCPTFAVHSDPKKRLRHFIQHRGKGILIVSYETQRRYSQMFLAGKGSAMLPNNGSTCDLLVCDEAHKLKNADSGLAKSLGALPARKRVLLSGTPMQNELSEFYNMVDFCNPGVIGTPSEFRRTYERPILQSREPDAVETQVKRAAQLQKELSNIVNEFILKRGNILNAQHLPPKLVQYVCCRLTPLQNALYDLVIQSKHARHVRDGKQMNTLNSLRYLMLICSHPDLLVSAHRQRLAESKGDGVDEELQALVDYIQQHGSEYSSRPGNAISAARVHGGGAVSRADRALIRTAIRGAGVGGGKAAVNSGFDPELSGKFLVLYRLMCALRVHPARERIVIVSNSTQTLDLIEAMCRDNNWPTLRLDGSTNANKRTKLVAQFNDKCSNSFAFLLSSKAGGCGINLIGGSRLVMFDPDWNPASDKQAAARIWREGQQRRCYIYRFMSTCTVEEKIIQRQLSKEGLQNIVDDKEQVNQFSTSELKSIFRRRKDATCSDTHDTLRCKRCSNVKILDAAALDDLQRLTAEHTSLCLSFLREVVRPQAVDVTSAVRAIDADGEDFCAEIDKVVEEMESGKFATLPLFSRRIRGAMKGIDDGVKEALGQSSVLADFIAAWSTMVPRLTSLSNKLKAPGNKTQSSLGEKGDGDKENSLNDSHHATSPSGEDECADGDGDEEEYVEQEGCPNEEDFNKWSHHTSVNTCDDEALQQALGDDNTVSFVFGLEVNWSLLQAKIALESEDEERRKEQQRLDLERLNADRRRRKRISLGLASGSDSDGDDNGNIVGVGEWASDEENDGDVTSATKTTTDRTHETDLYRLKENMLDDDTCTLARSNDDDDDQYDDDHNKAESVDDFIVEKNHHMSSVTSADAKSRAGSSSNSSSKKRRASGRESRRSNDSDDNGDDSSFDEDEDGSAARKRLRKAGFGSTGSDGNSVCRARLGLDQAPKASSVAATRKNSPCDLKSLVNSSGQKKSSPRRAKERLAEASREFVTSDCDSGQESEDNEEEERSLSSDNSSGSEQHDYDLLEESGSNDDEDHDVDDVSGDGKGTETVLAKPTRMASTAKITATPVRENKAPPNSTTRRPSSDSHSSEQGKTAAASTTPTTIACRKCTYHNAPGSRKCAMCLCGLGPIRSRSSPEGPSVSSSSSSRRRLALPTRRK